MLVELLAHTPLMADLKSHETDTISALRLWARAMRAGQCAVAAAAERLGTRRAAAHLHLMLAEIGASWPERFAVSPPCCPRLTHDEALLAEMMTLAMAGDRPGFDRLLCDLIPADARERLFLSAGVLGQALQA